MHRRIFLIGCVTYLVLAILAYIFYLERISFLDSAYILFSILKDGTSAIQVNRFGSILTQMYPFIFSKLGFSLSAICKLYSVGFIFHYFICFFICSKILKQHKLALCLLLFNTLMVVHSFYWIMNELIQGMAFMVVFFAVVSYIRNTKEEPFWYRPLNAVMILTLAFFHPLIILPFIFTLGYFYRFEVISKEEVLKNSFLFLAFYFIKYFFFSSNYDSQAMSGLGNFVKLFPNYFTIESNINFLKYLITDYFVLIPLIIFILYWFLKEKVLVPAVFIFLFFIGYLFVINISYADGPNQFYVESLYLPLSYFLILPLVYFILPKLKKQYVIIALSCIIGIKCIQITMAHHSYTDRVSYLRKILKDTADEPIKKIILDKKIVDMETLKMNWGSPYEFWLLSTLDSNVSRSIVIIENPATFNWALPKQNAFITQWGVFEYSTFPQNYFNFQDSSKYVIKQELNDQSY